ncbi:arabinofuranosidase catalytic domain-containing protein [Ancylobacter sp. IITR112]|uniref:arabinofuranosidase catalytic domain-containing protein n=1 Tax=Ancylobacter sp. IITR112 TaxID=3138073 RepID=UPI00352B7AF3
MAAFGFSLSLAHRGARPAARPVLDAFAGTLYAAYGLTRLLTAQTGPGVRVRRSSDGAEADIGFTPLGALDSAALLAFAGTASAYAVIWYDQSGNGRHATQSVTAAQPRLVNAGALDTGPNGRPVLAFSGSQNFGIAGAADFARKADNVTIGVAGLSSATAGSAAFFSASKGANLSWYRAGILHTPTLAAARFAASANDLDNPPLASRGYVMGSWARFIGRARFLEDGLDFAIDGATTMVALGTSTASVDSDSTVRIGVSPNGGAPLYGQMSALVLARAPLAIAALDAALQGTLP